LDEIDEPGEQHDQAEPLPADRSSWWLRLICLLFILVTTVEVYVSIPTLQQLNAMKEAATRHGTKLDHK
jgi:hypothetical protein